MGKAGWISGAKGKKPGGPKAHPGAKPRALAKRLAKKKSVRPSHSADQIDSSDRDFPTPHEGHDPGTGRPAPTADASRIADDRWAGPDTRPVPRQVLMEKWEDWQMANPDKRMKFDTFKKWWLGPDRQEAKSIRKKKSLVTKAPRPPGDYAVPGGFAPDPGSHLEAEHKRQDRAAGVPDRKYWREPQGPGAGHPAGSGFQAMESERARKDEAYRLHMIESQRVRPSGPQYPESSGPRTNPHLQSSGPSLIPTSGIGGLAAAGIASLGQASMGQGGGTGFMPDLMLPGKMTDEQRKKFYEHGNRVGIQRAEEDFKAGRIPGMPDSPSSPPPLSPENQKKRDTWLENDRINRERTARAFGPRPDYPYGPSRQEEHGIVGGLLRGWEGALSGSANSGNAPSPGFLNLLGREVRAFLGTGDKDEPLPPPQENDYPELHRPGMYQGPPLTPEEINSGKRGRRFNREGGFWE